MRWTPERAATWQAEQPWRVGCNFIPSNAINQLEMWQAETFDPATLARELDLAANLGFNSLRVYLHDQLWRDSAGLLKRLDAFLKLTWERGMTVMLVFFDSCWANQSYLGPQPTPVPGMHNSGWLQSPAAKFFVFGSAEHWAFLEAYVKGVMEAFKDDDVGLLQRAR